MSNGVQGRVVYQLKRAEQALRAAIDDSLAPLGITSAQYGVLSALAAAPGATSAELARACLVSAQSMHELVRVLIDRGLIDRVRRDGRSLQLDVSAAGRALLSDADPLVDGAELATLGEPAEREQLDGVLAGLVARLNRPGPGSPPEGGSSGERR